MGGSSKAASNCIFHFIFKQFVFPCYGRSMVKIIYSVSGLWPASTVVDCCCSKCAVSYFSKVCPSCVRVQSGSEENVMSLPMLCVWVTAVRVAICVLSISHCWCTMFTCVVCFRMYFFYNSFSKTVFTIDRNAIYLVPYWVWLRRLKFWKELWVRVMQQTAAVHLQEEGERLWHDSRRSVKGSVHLMHATCFSPLSETVT